jgi:hypothetical protein
MSDFIKNRYTSDMETAFQRGTNTGPLNGWDFENGGILQDIWQK